MDILNFTVTLLQGVCLYFENILFLFEHCQEKNIFKLKAQINY